MLERNPLTQHIGATLCRPIRLRNPFRRLHRCTFAPASHLVSGSPQKATQTLCSDVPETMLT